MQYRNPPLSAGPSLKTCPRCASPVLLRISNPFHPGGKDSVFSITKLLSIGLGETRPSATRIKLIGRDKQRFPSRDIYVDAFTLFIPIFILESSFRRRFAVLPTILFGGEFRAQCLIIRFLEFLLRYRLVRGFPLISLSGEIE